MIKIMIERAISVVPAADTVPFPVDPTADITIHDSRFTHE